MDSSGRLCNLNRTACEMFGYERDDAVGQFVADLIVPERYRAAHWAGLVRIAHGEEPRMLGRRVRLSACRADGSEIPIELVVSRSTDDPASFTGFIRDLSDLEQARAADQRARALLSSAERLGQVGSWTYEPRTGEMTWSTELCRIVGLDPARVEPSVELARGLVHPVDRDRVLRVFNAPRSGPEPFTAECRLVLGDGAVRNVVTRTWVETGADGSALRYTGFVQDVTAERIRRRGETARYAISRTLREWESFDEGIPNLLRRMGFAMRWAVTSVWIPDAMGVLACRGFWALPGLDSAGLERASHALRVTPGEGLLGRAWADGTAVLADDVSGDPRREHLEALGVRSATAFPAVADDEVVVVFESFATERLPTEPRALAQSTRRVLYGVGREVGLFLAPRRAALAAPLLSPREIQVLQLAAEGQQVTEIAESLTISPMTVKSHLRRIYGKLGVTGRVAAVAQGLRSGLIT